MNDVWQFFFVLYVLICSVYMHIRSFHIPQKLELKCLWYFIRCVLIHWSERKITGAE